MNKILFSGITLLLLIPFPPLVHADTVNDITTKSNDLFSKLIELFKNLFGNLQTTIMKNIPNNEQSIQPQKEQSTLSTTPKQISVDSSEKPCILDTSKPSLTGGIPTNPPCIIQHDSTKMYCYKDNTGISCSITKPQQPTQSLQNTPIQQEQSPYGPKQTQYYFDQLRQQPRFMDCTDEQLIHYLNIQVQFDSLSYVHAPPVIAFSNSDEEKQYAQSHPDAYRYMVDMENLGKSSQEDHWVSEKQAQYNTLLNQVQNYHC